MFDNGWWNIVLTQRGILVLTIKIKIFMCQAKVCLTVMHKKKIVATEFFPLPRFD
jgi:hypothetical protein